MVGLLWVVLVVPVGLMIAALVLGRVEETITPGRRPEAPAAARPLG